jgi:hypothetical protein
MALTPDQLAQSEKMLREGMTYGQIATHYGVSKGSFASSLWRYRDFLANGPKPKATQCQAGHSWSEESLTERWADRKARLARERAQGGVHA